MHWLSWHSPPSEQLFPNAQTWKIPPWYSQVPVVDEGVGLLHDVPFWQAACVGEPQD